MDGTLWADYICRSYTHVKKVADDREEKRTIHDIEGSVWRFANWTEPRLDNFIQDNFDMRCMKHISMKLRSE